MPGDARGSEPPAPMFVATPFIVTTTCNVWLWAGVTAANAAAKARVRIGSPLLIDVPQHWQARSKPPELDWHRGVTTNPSSDRHSGGRPGRLRELRRKRHGRL